MDIDVTKTDKELTDKFLRGELSFTEYSERWSGENCAEDDEAGTGEAEGDVEQEEVGDTTKTQQKRVRGKRPHRRLTPALSGLMGEANLRYARGERDTAEKMCYEIIRQAPTAFEPFQTLAQIYESDPDKSLQFALIAAHLNPSESEQWIKLAEVSRSKGDLKQATICYSKAINADPESISNHTIRLKLVEEMIENKLCPPGNLNPAMCKMRMISCYPQTEGPTILMIAKTVAREFHAVHEYNRACLAMDKAYNRFPSLFDFEDLNLYLELLIALKRFDKCIQIFVAHCEVEIEEEMQIMTENELMEEVRMVQKCSVPSSIPIDLRAKLLICLIGLKQFHLVDSFLDDIIENEDVETVGDIFLDIEEALTSEKLHAQAFRLLNVLVSSTRFSLPAVWLKYAECLTALNCFEKAIEAYESVVNLAPQHIDARIKLANLLKESGNAEKALNILEQNEKTDVLDTTLLYERCLMLKSLGDKEKYLEVGSLLLSRHFFVIRNRGELDILRIKDTYEHLKILREARGEPLDEPNAPVFHESSTKLSVEVEWELLNDLLKTACELKKYGFLERLTYSALGSKRFNEHKNELQFACLLACYYNGDYANAFVLFRFFLLKMPDKVSVWNFLNLIINGTKRCNKFLIRLQRQTEDKILKVLYGNYCLTAGTYKYALKEYINNYKTDNNSLSALLCGVTMCHMASQKFSSNKDTLITQCFAFMSFYQKLRGPGASQEIYYNIGRAYHQLGLLNWACQYYKLALNAKIEAEDSDDIVFDLKKEIAYNLHLIYRNTAPDLAMMYLTKYIVID